MQIYSDRYDWTAYHENRIINCWLLMTFSTCLLSWKIKSIFLFKCFYLDRFFSFLSSILSNFHVLFLQFSQPLSERKKLLCDFRSFPVTALKFARICLVSTNLSIWIDDAWRLGVCSETISECVGSSSETIYSSTSCRSSGSAIISAKSIGQIPKPKKDSESVKLDVPYEFLRDKMRACVTRCYSVRSLVECDGLLMCVGRKLDHRSRMS